MNKCVKYAALIVCMAFFVAMAACSSSKSDESTNISLETGAEDIASLGVFPVGIRDYTPPAIEITSPLSVNPVTTVAKDGSVYLKEVVPGEKWALEVKGEVTPSTIGIEGNRLELKGVYVNTQLVDSANGDDIKWVNGKFTFTKTVYITKEDIAGTFYSIVIAAVDEKNYVSGTKSVVILQDRAANKINDPLVDALHLSGNKEFVSNVLSILISQIDGLNLAPNIKNPDKINILTDYVLVPRTVMLQGVEISDYSISANTEGLCSVSLNIRVSNLVAEFTNKLSVFRKGQNVVNINMKNVEIDGLIIELTKGDNGEIVPILKVGDLALVKGEGFKYNLDTPFTEVFNYLLDNVFSFLVQDIFNQLNQKPVQLKLGYYALKLLIKQLSGNVNVEMDSFTGLKYITQNNGGINLGMDVKFPISEKSESKLTSTYSSSQAKSDRIDLAVNHGNSKFALSDDMINQMLAMNFPDNTQEISSLDLNELIKEMGIDIGDYKLWPWLRDGNDELPKIKIKYRMPTPPVLKIQGNGNYIGNLYVRNVLVEVCELDDQGKESELLAKLSISLDIAMKWENGKFVLECGKGNASYLLLFNKLYPMLIPQQMKEIHTYIANNLNQLLSKIGLIGYPIENVSTMNDAYLVFSGSLLNRDKIGSGSSDMGYDGANWNYQYITSNPNIGTVDKLNGSNKGSISFNTLDKNNDDQVKNKYFRDLEWNDSRGYFYDIGEDSNKLITGISFTRNVLFDWITGNTVEFYEEFAVMCIAYGNATEDINSDYIPGEGCLIPYELTLEDKPEIEMPDFQTFNIPLSTNVGIGIRVKKDPSIPLKANPIALQMASASNIKIKYIDLNLDQGLKF